MAKLCRICGSIPMQGARFCRVCGTPLNATGSPDGDAAVSPQAQTIPLVGEGRATDGIAPEDVGYTKPDTAKVKQDEMERMLRHAPDGRASQFRVATDDSQTLAAAPSTGLATETANEPDGQRQIASSSSSSTGKAAAATRPRRTWQVIAVIVLCIALATATLAYFYSRQPAAVHAGGAAPIPISDHKKLVDEQLSEADSLLASGDTDGAIAKLRYAVKLDPTNAEAHRRLGHALEKKGERLKAIEEYRIATEQDPSNTAAWRALASAQFSEALYQDAAESYRRIISAMDESAVDDNLRLEYADALRLAGRSEEARALYQKVSASESLDLARRANEQLAVLPPTQPQQSNSNSESPREQDGTTLAQNLPANGNTAQANATVVVPSQPTPAPTVNARPAANTSEQFYNEALNIVRGRNVKSLQRAELLRALQLFQNVKDGPHSSDARKYAERLGKEYDRRRKNE